jgi:plastocyanin
VNIRPALVALLIGALSLSACISAPVAPTPTSAPAAPTSAPATQPPQPTAAPAQPTAVFETVTDAGVEPTVGPIAPTVTGALAWRDQVLRNDAVAISITGLEPPGSGNVYAAWLATKESSLPLGAMTTGENGLISLVFASPNQQNLIGSYERIYITKGPLAEATSNPSTVVLGGALPEQALAPIRSILVSAEATPDKLGFALGLRQESDELLRHAQFLRDAYDAGDLALERVHGEHLINIIRGSEARDANGDGKLQNPGDGYGLLPNGQQDGYIKGMIEQAKLAAAAPDATDAIKLHAGHVQIAGQNTSDRVDQIRALAEQVVAASDTAATQQNVLAILTLAEQAIQGIDINLDEQVGPIAGEGGVITAYQHAQLMASVPLVAPDSAVLVPTAAPAAAAPTTAPAAGGAAPAPAAQTVEVAIGDNTFSPKKLTVAVGTSVVWKQGGQRPHTVTADDGSFASGNMDAGATFSQTFTKAGTFPYFCEYHGGAGGTGMAATIVVADGSAAAAPPAPAPAPTTAAPAPTTAAPAPAPAAGGAAVEIGDNTFTPKELNIPVGATVTWTSVGQKPHTVTADDGSFKSDTLQNGGTFAQTFDKPGTYRYYCEFHGSAGGPGMSGVITGGDAAQAPPPAAPPAPAPQAATNVSMKDFTFEPAELHIKVGQSVTWTNDGQKRHSATAVDGSFDTGLYGAGEAKTVQFNSPGTFRYFCQLHGAPDGSSGMVATVIVE